MVQLLPYQFTSPSPASSSITYTRISLLTPFTDTHFLFSLQNVLTNAKYSQLWYGTPTFVPTSGTVNLPSISVVGGLLRVELCPPKNDLLTSLLLVPKDVTLFGDRVLTTESSE